MIRKGFWLFCIAFSILFNSCREHHTDKHPSTAHCVKEASLPVKYALGFSVDYYNGFKVISVKDRKDSTKIITQYVLHRKSAIGPVDFPNALLIDTPVKRVI